MFFLWRTSLSAVRLNLSVLGVCVCVFVSLCLFILGIYLTQVSADGVCLCSTSGVLTCCRLFFNVVSLSLSLSHSDISVCDTNFQLGSDLEWIPCLLDDLY